MTPMTPSRRAFLAFFNNMKAMQEVFEVDNDVEAKAPGHVGPVVKEPGNKYRMEILGNSLHVLPFQSRRQCDEI